jgi:hypothetical protein
MPGKLKVRILAGRDLPVMDRSTDLTDAFVEVNFRCQCTQQKLQSICAVLTFDPQLKKS